MSKRGYELCGAKSYGHSNSHQHNDKKYAYTLKNGVTYVNKSPWSQNFSPSYGSEVSLAMHHGMSCHSADDEVLGPDRVRVRLHDGRCGHTKRLPSYVP